MGRNPGDDTWADVMTALAPLGAAIADRALYPTDPLSRQETYRQLALAFSQGVIQHVYGDPAYPDFVPHLNHMFTMAAPPPDYMYLTARVRGDGVYRISGYRGTSRFADVDVLTGHHSTGGHARSVSSFTLDDLKVDGRDYFSTILSKEQPANHKGD